MGRAGIDGIVEVFNVFNHANFVPVVGISSTLANWRVTGLTGTNTSRTVQIVSRLNW